MSNVVEFTYYTLYINVLGLVPQVSVQPGDNDSHVPALWCRWGYRTGSVQQGRVSVEHHDRPLRCDGLQHLGYWYAISSQPRSISETCSQLRGFGLTFIAHTRRWSRRASALQSTCAEPFHEKDLHSYVQYNCYQRPATWLRNIQYLCATLRLAGQHGEQHHLTCLRQLRLKPG